MLIVSLSVLLRTVSAALYCRQHKFLLRLNTVVDAAHLQRGLLYRHRVVTKNLRIRLLFLSLHPL